MNEWYLSVFALVQNQDSRVHFRGVEDSTWAEDYLSPLGAPVRSVERVFGRDRAASLDIESSGREGRQGYSNAKRGQAFIHRDKSLSN